MIKIFATILPLMLSTAILAQFKKKSILLGGQLFYYNEKNQVDIQKQKAESGTIGISIGKAFKENSVIGINLTYNPSKETNFLNGNDTVATIYKRYDIGAFFREYKKLGKDFYFFGQLDGAFIMANQKNDYSSATGDVKATQRGGFTSLTIGVSYKIFKKMQVELTIPNLLSIQYLVTKFDSQNSQVKNSKKEQFLFYSNLTNNTNLGFLGVGFRFIL